MPSRRVPRHRRGSQPAHLGAPGIAGWALVGAPAMAATARLARIECTAPLLMAEALGPLIGMPAVAALGVGVSTGRRRLALVAAAAAGLQLAWLAADLHRAGPAASHSGSAAENAGGDPSWRLFSANVLFTNSYLDGIAAELRTTDPDVVVLQEVSALTVDGLGRAGILHRFPHRWLTPRPDPRGTAILSRFPLENAESCVVAGTPVARATVVVGDRRLRLYNVHVHAPFGPGGRAIWKAQLGTLAEVVRTEDGPLVLVGDFNAACGHRPFRAVVAAGVRDAHMTRRRWWATTWPSNMRVAPPFALIDHVLVSPHLAVLRVGEGVGRGSDHRPVFADLAVVG